MKNYCFLKVNRVKLGKLFILVKINTQIVKNMVRDTFEWS